MKKIYQKPGISILYFEERSIMTDSTNPDQPLYTEEETETFNLAIRSYKDIIWE